VFTVQRNRLPAVTTEKTWEGHRLTFMTLDGAGGGGLGFGVMGGKSVRMRVCFGSRRPLRAQRVKTHL
jgi:hypothetical protein